MVLSKMNNHEHRTKQTYESYTFQPLMAFCFKILLLTYKAINGLAPFYLQELVSLEEACRYKLRSECDGLLLNPLKFKT